MARLEVEGLCCPVSQEQYSAEEPNRPVALICGHTISEASLRSILNCQASARLCPICRSVLPSGSPAAYNFNHALLDTLHALFTLPLPPIEHTTSGCNGAASTSAAAHAASPGPTRGTSTAAAADTNRQACGVLELLEAAVTSDADSTTAEASQQGSTSEDAVPGPPPFLPPPLRLELSARYLLPVVSPVPGAVWERILERFKLPEASAEALQQATAGSQLVATHVDAHGRHVYCGLFTAAGRRRRVALVRAVDREMAVMHAALHLLPDAAPLLAPLIAIIPVEAQDPQLPAECLLLYGVEGVSLREHLETLPSGHMPPGAAMSVALQLVTCINALHANGTTTHALAPASPDTVYVSPQAGNEFSITLLPAMSCTVEDTAKSCGCNPPETIRNTAYPEPTDKFKEDVWRLAAVVLYAVAGRTGFQRANLPPWIAADQGLAQVPLYRQERVMKSIIRTAEMLAGGGSVVSALGEGLRACLKTASAARWSAERLMGFLLARQASLGDAADLHATSERQQALRSLLCEDVCLSLPPTSAHVSVAGDRPHAQQAASVAIRLRCPVSQEPYSTEGPYRPMVLACGHSISEASLQAILRDTARPHKCPSCRRLLLSRQLSTYRVNYSLLDVLSTLQAPPRSCNAQRITHSLRPPRSMATVGEGTTVEAPLPGPAPHHDHRAAAGVAATAATAGQRPPADVTQPQLTVRDLLPVRLPVPDSLWMRVLEHFQVPPATLAGLQEPWCRGRGWDPIGIDGHGRAVHCGYVTVSGRRQAAAAVQVHGRAAVVKHAAGQLILETENLVTPLLGIFPHAQNTPQALRTLLYAVEGRSLRAHLSQLPHHRMLPQHAVEMGLQLAKCIDIMNSHGLTSHALAAISPDSVYVSDGARSPGGGPSVQLVPFMNREAANRWSTCGCRPPEARNRLPLVDSREDFTQRSRCDVWRVAAVTVLAIGGGAPFKRASSPPPGATDDLQEQQLKSILRDACGRSGAWRLPAAVDAALQACLQTEPSERWSAQRLSVALMTATSRPWPQLQQAPREQQRVAAVPQARPSQGPPANARGIRTRVHGRTCISGSVCCYRVMLLICVMGIAMMIVSWCLD